MLHACQQNARPGWHATTHDGKTPAGSLTRPPGLRAASSRQAGRAIPRRGSDGCRPAVVGSPPPRTGRRPGTPRRTRHLASRPGWAWHGSARSGRSTARPARPRHRAVHVAAAAIQPEAQAIPDRPLSRSPGAGGAPNPPGRAVPPLRQRERIPGGRGGHGRVTADRHARRPAPAGDAEQDAAGLPRLCGL